jgi:hypothetical protein
LAAANSKVRTELGQICDQLSELSPPPRRSFEPFKLRYFFVECGIIAAGIRKVSIV